MICGRKWIVFVFALTLFLAFVLLIPVAMVLAGWDPEFLGVDWSAVGGWLLIVSPGILALSCLLRYRLSIWWVVIPGTVLLGSGIFLMRISRKDNHSG